MKTESQQYRAKSLTTKMYVYGALTITKGYYEGYAIIHTTDVIPEAGEEGVGGWEFIHQSIVVDIDTVEEVVTCENLLPDKIKDTLLVGYEFVNEEPLISPEFNEDGSENEDCYCLVMRIKKK